MASDKSNVTRAITFPDPPSSSSNYAVAVVPVARLNEEIMDAAFVKAVATESYPGGEEALERDHRFGDTVPLGRHWSYKYLIDMDGMSYSGRFLAFLASDSVPLKSTVYEEFFSDWIQPWYATSVFAYSDLINQFVTLQGSFHPSFFHVQGNIQYPCLFFGSYTVDIGSCQFYASDRARGTTTKNIGS